MNFCKLFLKIFSVLTGKAGGFIDLKVYKKNSSMKTILLSDIDKKGCPKTIRTMGDLVRADPDNNSSLSEIQYKLFQEQFK